MSESVNIITKKELEPDDIFDELDEAGEDICVVSDEWPYLRFGTYEKSLRGVEITKEEKGYEIRVCSFSTFDDYRLFRETIDIVKKMTRGKVEYDCEVVKGFDSYELFSDNWIDKQVESGVDAVRILSNHEGKPVTMYGMFAPFCFGRRMLEHFGLDDGHKPTETEIYKILKYFREMQWRLENLTSTKSHLMVQGENGENDKDVSLIAIKDGKVSDFDYISFAQMMGICDLDNDETALIKFEKFIDIVPKDKVEFLDECQMLIKTPFTADEVRKMIADAKKLM